MIVAGVDEGAEGSDRADEAGPRLWLIRHGETEWARLGRHTGRTDVPLTPTGREQAVTLGRALRGETFSAVLTSPLGRARDTARLAGFADATVDPDLAEWDYGALEGRRSEDISAEMPGWTIWRGPWPDGETIEDVALRADRVLARVRGLAGDVAIFSHGHLLRVLTARWLELEPTAGGLFALSTATVSVLGWERERSVVERWNEACHLD